MIITNRTELSRSTTSAMIPGTATSEARGDRPGIPLCRPVVITTSSHRALRGQQPVIHRSADRPTPSSPARTIIPHGSASGDGSSDRGES